jgi:hypothetical protein
MQLVSGTLHNSKAKKAPCAKGKTAYKFGPFFAVIVLRVSSGKRISFYKSDKPGLDTLHDSINRLDGFPNTSASDERVAMSL